MIIMARGSTTLAFIQTYVGYIFSDQCARDKINLDLLQKDPKSIGEIFLPMHVDLNQFMFYDGMA